MSICGHESCGEIRRDRFPDNNMPAMARYLLANLDWLRHHPAGDEAVDELRDAIGRARRAVDTPAERLYAGPCDPEGLAWVSEDPEADNGPQNACHRELYATLGKEFVTCDACGLVWRVKDRREYLLDSASEQLVTATDLSRFLTAYGEPLTAERIWQWASRGQLVAHGHDPNGRPLYRVGDATDVLSRLPQRARRAS